MTEAISPAAMIRLQNWLSPVFPIGSFAYSAGLERAVHDDIVRDETSLADWLKGLVRHGTPWNDLVLLTASWRAAQADSDLQKIADLGLALNASAERRDESVMQGIAFCEAASGWSDSVTALRTLSEVPLPVAVGALTARDIPVHAVLASYLQAFINNQLQAAIRLSVLGQTGAARLMAQFEPIVLELAEKAAATTLDDLGSAGIMADIVAQNHERQTVRLFRS